MTETATRRTADDTGSLRARNTLSGVLFGIGVAAFIDETVFHQLLHWHHFYDKSTLEVGLVSDGLFHAFGWFATVAGLFLLADLRRRERLWWTRWIGGLLVGAGGFQLYDGTVQHKLMRCTRSATTSTSRPTTWSGTSLAAIMIGAGRRAADRVPGRAGRRTGQGARTCTGRGSASSTSPGPLLAVAAVVGYLVAGLGPPRGTAVAAARRARGCWASSPVPPPSPDRWRRPRTTASSPTWPRICCWAWWRRCCSCRLRR